MVTCSIVALCTSIGPVGGSMLVQGRALALQLAMMPAALRACARLAVRDV